jgi:3-oxoacyl-(acyl-carrier-protein) synthase
VYGFGVIAPGARNVEALKELLRSGRSALGPDARPELGHGLFAVGDPAFSFDDYAAWIAARHGDAYAKRLEKKMGDNVQFAVGAAIQALTADPRLEGIAKELDERCHVYVGSGVGDLPQSYKASRSLTRATQAWNAFWAEPARNAARRRFVEGGPVEGDPPPVDPKTLPADSLERFDAACTWNAYWAERSDVLQTFLRRFAEVEGLDAKDDDAEKAHLDAIRRRVRAHRALVDEFGCPPPPWTAVSPDLIWNIQNSPAAQLTMLLGVHGEAWAPVGACSTFGVALKCGRDAILAGEAKMAIVGTTDPRPDAALVGAFHDARVMPGTGKVNVPFTSLRGTHVSGGACMWILGDEAYFAEKGLLPLTHLEAVAISSDAEHIITPSKTGPKRAIQRAYAEAAITPSDVAICDLHATGTPGDLNELTLMSEYLGPSTRITARKGQLGHGMANSGGWELTALALGLADGAALATGIPREQMHPKVAGGRAAIVSDAEPVEGTVGVKTMLGIGGITACVVLRAPR